MRVPITVITGPPGAGKTTVAHLVARSYERSVHLVADQCFRWITGGFLPPWVPESAPQNATVIEAVAMGAARYAEGGYYVIVDGIVGPWYLQRFRAAAGTAGRRMGYVVLRPTRAVALAQAAARGGEADLADPEPAALMYDAFDDLGPFEAHVIDSSDLSAENTASLVLDGIASGRFLLADRRALGGEAEKAGTMPMAADGVVELLGRSTLGVDAWVDGGWGIDALLGRQTRPHGDLDLVVALDDIPLVVQGLARWGFVLVADERPTRAVLGDPAGRQLDLHTVTFDAGGGGVQLLPGGRSYRYPPEGLNARGRIRGQPVRCLSPAVQMECHLGYEPREKDCHDMAVLAGRFSLVLPPPYSPDDK